MQGFIHRDMMEGMMRHLPTDNDEHSIAFGIAGGRVLNTIKLATFHSAT